MDNKKHTVEAFLSYLSMPQTAMKIADKLKIDLSTDKVWFLRTYRAATGLFLQSGEELKKTFPSGIDKEDMQGLLSTLISVISASKQKLDSVKSTDDNTMYAINTHGDAHPVSSFSLNEGKWSAEQKEDFIMQLYTEGVIGRVMEKWEEEYPDVSTTQFDPALKMAMDVVMQQVQTYNTYPLMPSDLEEIEDILLELVLSFEPANNIFKSTGRAQKRKAKETPGFVDPDPFERGSYANLGLNEAKTGDWSETKLRQFIKKEFEAQIKKGEYMSKKEVKEMIRKTIVQQYKYLWEKSAFFINQI